ncbi:MAG: pilus assembly protein [Syntrophobacterales bacterium]|jgi:Flp pilus assembly protein TadG
MRLFRFIGPRSRRERGNIAVELALGMPLMLLLIGGMMDLGLLFWEQHVLTNATREGARVAAKSVGRDATAFKTQSEVQQVVQNYLDNFALKNLDGSSLVLDGSKFSYSWTSTGSDSILSVTLNQIPYRLMLLPYAKALFGYSMDEAFYLSAQTSMAADWFTPPSP